MTRKLPASVAQVTGAAKKNPARYGQKTATAPSQPLGDPPDWLTPEQQSAWRTLADEIPWLERPHRGLVSIAATLRARLESGTEIGVNALNLLRLCLAQMGASPTDAHRVAMPETGAENDADKYFS